jgi:hypothetical protein
MIGSREKTVIDAHVVEVVHTGSEHSGDEAQRIDFGYFIMYEIIKGLDHIRAVDSIVEGRSES